MAYFFKSLFLFLFMFVTFTSWFNNDEHKYITVINNSEKDIYVDYSPWVPDSLCTEIYQVHADPKWHLVKAHSSGTPHSLEHFYNTWENYYSSISSGKMIFFIHDAAISDSICQDESINWHFINEEKELLTYINELIIIKRFCYTLADLDSINWTITYP